MESETMRLTTIVMLTLVAIAPLSAMAYTTGGVNSYPPTAPTGYYFDPATSTWYYYDGTTLTAQPPGFTPPAAERIVYELRVYNADPTQIGWELHVEGKFIGATTIHYRVESEFVRNSQSFCPAGSQTTSPPCLITGSAPSQSYPVGHPLLPQVVSVINHSNAMSSWKPNSGTAESWGWLDDTPQEPSQATYHVTLQWNG